MIIRIIDKKYDDGADGFYMNLDTNALTIRTLQGCYEQTIVIPAEVVIVEPSHEIPMDKVMLDNHPHRRAIMKTFDVILAEAGANLKDELTAQHEAVVDNLTLDLPFGWE